MKLQVLIAAACIAMWTVVSITSSHTPIVLAAPTEEPTKAPYIFPTPIVIPQYPDETPGARTTPTPRTSNVPINEQSYVVQPNDSPWTIAQKVYGDGTKFQLIMTANNLTDAKGLRVGMTLKIPPLAGSAPATATTAPSPETTSTASTPEPTAIPTSSGLSIPTPSPYPANVAATSTTDIAPQVIKIISGLLALGGIVSGVLAYLMYMRTRRIEQLSSGKQPIRIQR